MSVTVYTLPACVQCDRTKKLLEKNEVAFDVVDLSENEDAMEMVKSLGYGSAPVVIAGDTHWAGFRPDMITALVS